MFGFLILQSSVAWRRFDWERSNSLSKEEYRMFRDDLEALSESVGLLRNHFYNHAFSDGTLIKVDHVRKLAEKLPTLVNPSTLDYPHSPRFDCLPAPKQGPMTSENLAH